MAAKTTIQLKRTSDISTKTDTLAAGEAVFDTSTNKLHIATADDQVAQNVPAINAATADTVVDEAISTAKIASKAVTAAKIADTTITDSQIATSADIAQSKISGLTTDLSNINARLDCLGFKWLTSTNRYSDFIIYNGAGRSIGGIDTPIYINRGYATSYNNDSKSESYRVGNIGQIACHFNTVPQIAEVAGVAIKWKSFGLLQDTTNIAKSRTALIPSNLRPVHDTSVNISLNYNIKLNYKWSDTTYSYGIDGAIDFLFKVTFQADGYITIQHQKPISSSGSDFLDLLLDKTKITNNSVSTGLVIGLQNSGITVGGTNDNVITCKYKVNSWDSTASDAREWAHS